MSNVIITTIYDKIQINSDDNFMFYKFGNYKD